MISRLSSRPGGRVATHPSRVALLASMLGVATAAADVADAAAVLAGPEVRRVIEGGSSTLPGRHPRGIPSRQRPEAIPAVKKAYLCLQQQSVVQAITTQVRSAPGTSVSATTTQVVSATCQFCGDPLIHLDRRRCPLGGARAARAVPLQGRSRARRRGRHRRCACRAPARVAGCLPHHEAGLRAPS